MNRRSFMQLLAGLLIFRHKMRAENRDGEFITGTRLKSQNHHVVGVDPASPDGDYGAIVVMKARSDGLTTMAMEGWPSGLRRSTANAEWVTPPRVRISPLPPDR